MWNSTVEQHDLFFSDAKAETPVLWPPHAKSWLVGTDPDAGRNWGQEEKGMTEDEMAGWHHRLDGHEFEWTPWVDDGQGGLACCDSWGCKESDTTELLNWTEYREIWCYLKDLRNVCEIWCYLKGLRNVCVCARARTCASVFVSTYLPSSVYSLTCYLTQIIIITLLSLWS